MLRKNELPLLVGQNLERLLANFSEMLLSCIAPVGSTRVLRLSESAARMISPRSGEGAEHFDQPMAGCAALV